MTARRGSTALLIGGTVLLALGLLGGLFATVSMLISAFGHVAHAPPAERAAMLSDGIRDATLYGVLGGGGVAAVGGVLTMMGLRRHARSSRTRA